MEDILFWIIGIVLVIGGYVLFRRILRSEVDKNVNDKKSNWVHVRSIVFMILGFVALLFVVGFVINRFSNDVSIFKNIGASLIISWVIFLVGYYVWAIYFYNVNYGWEENDWNEYNRKKDLGLETDKAPEENPHAKDSLGLPPGTIRGTIAITVLIGGLAVTIQAISFPEEYSGNKLIFDHFTFFKEAFLMVIAFYFGTKGLEIIRQNKSESAVATEVSTTQPEMNESISQESSTSEESPESSHFQQKGAVG